MRVLLSSASSRTHFLVSQQVFLHVEQLVVDDALPPAVVRAAKHVPAMRARLAASFSALAFVRLAATPERFAASAPRARVAAVDLLPPAARVGIRVDLARHARVRVVRRARAPPRPAALGPRGAVPRRRRGYARVALCGRVPDAQLSLLFQIRAHRFGAHAQVCISRAKSVSGVPSGKNSGSPR